MRVFLCLIGVCCVLFGSQQAQGNMTSIPLPSIVILIDDVGYHDNQSSLFELPNEVAFAILPDTPYAQHFAWMASHSNRDILIHMPMESLNGKLAEATQLNASQDHKTMARHLQHAFDKLPNAIGLSNHMGSRLTQLTTPMTQVMDFIRDNGLLFVDSRTTRYSRAQTIAANKGLFNLRRDIFIDNDLQTAAMTQQMEALIAHAKKHRIGVGIAHPHPETIRFLKDFLSNLSGHGVKLSSLRQLHDNHHSKQ